MQGVTEGPSVDFWQSAPEQVGPAQWRSPLGISGPTALRVRRRGG